MYISRVNYIQISADIHLIRIAQVCQTQYETSCVTKYKFTLHSTKYKVQSTKFIIVAQVCQTQYETSCVTKYKDTPVVENVEECNKVKYKLEYHDNSFVETFENEKQD